MISIQSTDTLQAKLGGTPSANPYFWGSYVDSTVAGGVTGDASIAPTQLNGASPVTVMSAPAPGTTRRMLAYRLQNTTAGQITWSLEVNSIAVLSFTLDVGDVLEYDQAAGVFVIKAQNGAAKSPGGAAIPHTPFGPDTATVTGSLTIPSGYFCLKATGAEDFLGMSPGSLQPGDIFYLALASGRIVRNGGSVVSPVVPFSMANGDLTAPAGAQLTWQLGPGGTQWILKGAV
jgi:hypothetical protein